MEEVVEKPKMNERTGFMIFIFILHLLSLVLSAGNVILVIIGAIYLLLTDPVKLLSALPSILIGSAIYALSIMYVVKVWKMSLDLKKWTDIMYGLSTLVLSLFTLYLMITLLNKIITGWVRASATEYVITGFFFFALVVEILFWIGIRTHLTRLEREGKAQFTPGLFNRPIAK